MEYSDSKLVSVFITTYNHEKFIAKALDSVLMQKVNFDYEIVIGEDCSIDKTRDIVLKYAKENPNKFKLLLNQKNLGIEKNQMYTLSQCSGKYVAWLEGDDYWTNPDKLQMQVDFLEKNHDFAGCCHYTDLIHNGKQIPQAKLTKDVFTIHDTLLSYTFFHTSSFVFKNNVKLPKAYRKVICGDYFIFNIVASLGKIKHFPIVMSNHLYHEKGLSFSENNTNKYLTNLDKKKIHLYNVMNEYFNYKYNDRLIELITPHKEILRLEHLKRSVILRGISKIKRIISSILKKY